MGYRFGAVETRIGTVWVGFGASGIVMVRPGTMTAEEFSDRLKKQRRREASPAEVPAHIARCIRAAVDGAMPERLAVDLSGLTPFQAKVLGLLRGIPRGEVRTYGWLARKAGRAGAARAVGNVMAMNPVPFILPCHRLVPSGGGAGHYAFGSEMKRDLLRREGASVPGV